jgi:hypothetical protein
MRRLISTLIATLIVSMGCAATSQEASAPNKSAGIRFPLRLLRGYKLQAAAGTDNGPNGKIWKENGPTIDFHIGPYFSEATESIRKEEILWREEQIVNGHSFTCVYTKSADLVISHQPLPVANFQAKIHRQQEMAEMLLMVLTFEPKGYPVDPKAIVSPDHTLP